MNNHAESNNPVSELEAELARLQALLNAKEEGARMMKQQGIEVGEDHIDKADLEAQYRVVKNQLIDLGAIQPELPNM